VVEAAVVIISSRKARHFSLKASKGKAFKGKAFKGKAFKGKAFKGKAFKGKAFRATEIVAVDAVVAVAGHAVGFKTLILSSSSTISHHNSSSCSILNSLLLDKYMDFNNKFSQLEIRFNKPSLVSRNINKRLAISFSLK
jgi:hypothetical protein